MKQKIIMQFFLILIVVFSMSCNKRIFDVILYSNHLYEATDINKILIVKSRLEIKRKFFEIGVIKSTKETSLEHIKEVASKNGADIIIDEGNLNFTLARYQNQKKRDSGNGEKIKT